MTTRWRRADGVLSREVGDSTFLSLGAAGKLYRLNPVGAAFWRCIEPPQRPDDLAAVFADAFPDVSREKIEADLAALVEELHDQGLIAPA